MTSKDRPPSVGGCHCRLLQLIIHTVLATFQFYSKFTTQCVDVCSLYREEIVLKNALYGTTSPQCFIQVSCQSLSHVVLMRPASLHVHWGGKPSFFLAEQDSFYCQRLYVVSSPAGNSIFFTERIRLCLLSPHHHLQAWLCRFLIRQLSKASTFYNAVLPSSQSCGFYSQHLRRRSAKLM